MLLPDVKRYSTAPDTVGIFSRYVDRRVYELSDHLGNVRAIVGDVKLPVSGLYKADLKGYSNYYPFGMLQPDRHWSSDNYRYGFGSHEKDDEIKGLGNHYSFGNYGYDPRIGRRWNVDPKFNEIAGLSPYSYALNNPIVYIDKDGKLPILPLLLKAGAAGAADMLAQAAMAYYFDPEVESVDQAFDKINWWQVTRSAGEGLIPWGIPGGRIGKAAATAAGDVLINAIEAGSDYTQEQALKDFAVGFIGDLAGGGLGELVSKYGTKGVANGLLKMGFGTKYIRQLTGGLSDVDARKWYLEQEASIPSLLDKSLSIEDQAKQAFNLRNKFRTDARDLMVDQAKANQIAKDNPNLTWDEIVAKTKAKGFKGDDVYTEIINSSQRSRQSVNEQLGVQPKK